MYDHMGVKVKDLAKSITFYGAALESLGLVVGSQDATSAGIGPKGAPSLWLYAAEKGATGLHLAFTAKSKAAVDAFHRAALAAGGKDNGKPGIRKDYAANYYAAFVLDPDGNNIEAVFMA